MTDAPLSVADGFKPPYGSFHEQVDAIWWARRWFHIYGSRYSVRWNTLLKLWLVRPTDKPAPKRRNRVSITVDGVHLGVITVTHLGHDFSDPHRCNGCGEHPTLTWAHTEEWRTSGKCVDCLIQDLQRNAA